MRQKSNRQTLQYLGAVSGRDEDKISAACLNINYHNETPFIDEGNCIYICRKLFSAPMTKESMLDSEIPSKWYSDDDYHTLYIGEITDFLAR